MCCLTPSVIVRNPEILYKFCEEGPVKEALEIREQRCISLSRNNAYSMLQECTVLKDLEYGKRVQFSMVQSNLDSVAVLGDHLIRLFACCASLVNANEAFEKILQPTLYTWGSIISAHANLGHGKTALELNHRMHLSGLAGNNHAYLAVIKACTATFNISHGRVIHSEIMEIGLKYDIVVGSCLVDMYAKCGSLEEAYAVFEVLSNPNIVTWNILISGYAKHGKGTYAFECFYKMQEDGIKPDKVTFLNISKACIGLVDINLARFIHNLIIAHKLHLDIAVGSTLVDVYAKCSSLEEAQFAFDKLQQRDIVSWGSMIAACAHEEGVLLGLKHVELMEQEGMRPNTVIYCSMLKACARNGSIEQGRIIHEHIMNCGVYSDIVIGNNLVHMYGKCGSLEEALKIFGKQQQKVALWEAMITACVYDGKGSLAINFFQEMQEEGLKADPNVLLSILIACGSIQALEHGRLIHDLLISRGLHTDVALQNAIIDMYAMCGSLKEARSSLCNVLDWDVVTWSIVISGYAKSHKTKLAFDCFEEMVLEGIMPNKGTFLSILHACSSMQDAKRGKLHHSWIIKFQLHSDLVLGNTLVDMYVKCMWMEEAHEVFVSLPDEDVVSWTALIAGHAQHGNIAQAMHYLLCMEQRGIRATVVSWTAIIGGCAEYSKDFLALELFERMQEAGIRPNKMTFLAILKVCGSIGAAQLGKIIINEVGESDVDVVMENSIVDMYANCGQLVEAMQVFDKLAKRTIVSWTVMIGAFAQHGNAGLAVQCFQNMEVNGINPDKVSFICVLIGCSHVGLIEEGQWYFRYMTGILGLRPDTVHYGCMIDLLSRAGNFKEAEAMLDTIQFKYVSGWKSLLNACRIYGNIDLGSQCFSTIISSDSEFSARYVRGKNIKVDQ